MSARAEKERAAAMRACMRRERLHVRIGGNRRDGTEVRVIGNVWDLHSTVCTCCPRQEANR